MKTRTKLTKTIQSLLCLLLAAVFVLSDTAGAQAASSKWKTVTLNSSCTEGITYTNYKTKTTMKLSKSGKTLTCTFSPYKANGTLRKSIDFKSALPEDVLAKFKDGEVYLYAYVRLDSSDCTSKGSQEEHEADLKSHGYTDYIKKHMNKAIGTKTTKHTGKNCMGSYNYFSNILLSDSNGGFTVTKSTISLGWGDTVDYNYLSHARTKQGEEAIGSLFLADKDGNKIINIKFQEYTYEKDNVTCSLEEIAEDDGDWLITMTSGESLPVKISFTGTAMTGGYSEAQYTSSLLTVKKDGTVTAKKGKYGVAAIDILGYRARYYIFITDGSSKMLKALEKYAEYDDGGYKTCTLTIGKDGKYTIK